MSGGEGLGHLSTRCGSIRASQVIDISIARVRAFTGDSCASEQRLTERESVMSESELGGAGQEEEEVEARGGVSGQNVQKYHENIDQLVCQTLRADD